MTIAVPGLNEVMARHTASPNSPNEQVSNMETSRDKIADIVSDLASSVRSNTDLLVKAQQTIAALTRDNAVLVNGIKVVSEEKAKAVEDGKKNRDYLTTQTTRIDNVRNMSLGDRIYAIPFPSHISTSANRGIPPTKVAELDRYTER